MAKILTLILSLSMFALACGNQFDNNTTGNDSFEKYHESLPSISLPYQFSSTDLPKSDFENNPPYSISSFNKFKFSEDQRVCLGKLVNEDYFIHLNCVKGDYGWVPLISVYGENGIKKQSINPFMNAGMGIGYLSVEHVTINTNLDIEVIDSTWQSELTEDGDDEIEGTKKLIVSRRKIEFDKNKGQYKNQ
ncbi:MAG: hypothetical protein KJ941_10620 [Bacteroidetes bacterium]|nr:hypothetical protein [Bacteroidota bacterium]